MRGMRTPWHALDRLALRPARRARATTALTIGALVLSAGAVALVQPSTPAAAVEVEPFNKSWSLQFTTDQRDLSEAAAVADARAYDVIAAHERTYERHLAKMRAANPRLKVIIYLNATFSWQRNLPSSWYMHDEAGNRIRARGWMNTFQMNPFNPDYRQWLQGEAKRLLAVTGYDGVFLDVLGPASLKLTYVTSLPYNPAARRTYTLREWLAGTRDLAGSVKSALGTRLVVGNGLVMGPSYFDPHAPTSSLSGSGLDALEAEAFLRGPEQRIDGFRTEESWKQDIDMVISLQDKGHRAAMVTKVWAPGSRTIKDRWHEYALASFLMASNGRSFFQFSYEEADLATPHAWDAVNIGTPMSAYTKTGGVYQRVFTKGRVLVNPTRDQVTVNLPNKFRTLSGSLVSSVTLRPDTGQVLTSTG